MSQEMIAANYPAFGPYTPDLIGSAGAALEELIRFLTYATTITN